LIGLPVHYRDRRTEGIMDRVFARIPKKEVFERTGIQFLPFNTIFQLAAMKEAGDPHLDQADSLLMMPDLFYIF
jgi:rhamnulokinase